MKTVYLFIILILCINLVVAKPQKEKKDEDLSEKSNELKAELEKEEEQAKLDMEKENKAFVDRHINDLVNHFYPDPTHQMLVKDKSFEYPTDYEDCLNDLIATWKKYCGNVTDYFKEQEHTLKNLCAMNHGDNDEFFTYLKESCLND